MLLFANLSPSLLATAATYLFPCRAFLMFLDIEYLVLVAENVSLLSLPFQIANDSEHPDVLD